MAGTVAAVFGDSILSVLELGDDKLSILYREAERQRWLQGMMVRRAYHDKNFHKGFETTMKIHGEYTEGFHRKELDALRSRFGGRI